jgi:hypothetical protein
MKTQVQNITPERAKELLGRNSHNRPINWRIVDTYAKAMSEGRWKLNGETIIMNGDRLLNGQKRLHACVKAGVSFDTLVVEGVDSGVFDTIDQNEVRSKAQILSIGGIPDAKRVATAIAWAAILRSAAGRRTVAAARNMPSLTAVEMMGIAEGNDALFESVRSAQKAYRSFVAIMEGPLAGLHVVLRERNEPMLDDFMEGLASGVGLEAGDPRLALRSRLIDRRAKRDKENIDHVCAMYVYTWNAYKQGRKMSRLVIHPNSDKLPTIA